MSIPHATDQFYNKVIEGVINSMRVPLLNEGYDEDIVQKIRRNWSESLRKSLRNPPAIKPALIMPEPVALIKKEESPEELPIQVEEEEEEEDSCESMEDEDDASDPDEEAAMIFKQSKEKEELSKLKNKPDLEMIRQDILDTQEVEEKLPSDNETNIEDPHAEDEMICMYQKVTRKGNKWTLGLSNCVLQTRNNGHHIIRNVNGTIHF